MTTEVVMRLLAILLIGACVPEGSQPKPSVEDCTNLTDDDGDDLADCADPDCAALCGENCTDGIDNDADGLVDCFDEQCDGLCAEICDDGRDNDGDGMTDCEDRDCVGFCPEICDDGIDNDGDGLTDCVDDECVDPSCPESCTDDRDNDADGLVDCADPDCVNPACPEDCSDDRDNDGDSRIDCDDSDCDGACPEVCDDGRDNDADGLVDCDDDECTAVCDADGDGFFSTEYGGDDCDDTRFEVNPARPEVCNGDASLDDDCNGLVDEEDPDIDPFSLILWYPDGDADGHGNNTEVQFACSQPDGWTAGNLDCDDERPDVNPDMPEICNPDEPVDDDCDGLVDDDDPDVTEDSWLDWYEDADDDGYGREGVPFGACSAPDGYASNDDDCDDLDPEVGPPSLWLPDDDGDGRGTGAPWGPDLTCEAPAPGHAPDWRGEDCDDTDPTIYPGAEEVCDDGIDQSCDGEDAPCDGDLLYAADGQCGGGHYAGDPPALYELNTDTGAERVVCSLGNGYSGLTFDLETETLYGIADSCSGGGIYEIDMVRCTETLLATPVSWETGIAWADGLLYAVDTSTSTYQVDPADGSSRSLGFSSADCCGADIAADEFGTMYYADGGHTVGIVDLATGSKTDLFAGDVYQAITFHNGEVVRPSCTDISAMDPITGAPRSLGMSFSSCTLDAIASPTP